MARKIERLVVHHTASESDTVESIRKEHRKRGYNDIGYHFVIYGPQPGPDGHIAVGRPETIVGSAVKLRNAGNLYCCLVGELHKQPATEKQLHALGHWLLVKGVANNVPSHNILGHREWALPGHGTLCPGNLPMADIRVWYHQNIVLARKHEVVQSLAEYLKKR